jgi:nitroreductase
MDALQVLQTRVSITKLVEPVPSSAQLLEVFKAAARAPDHGKLKPWRFLVVQGEGLRDLSDVLVAGLVKSNPEVSPAIIEKTKNMPFRAPMIVVAVAKCQDHPSVPQQEQIIACGAAVQNMLNALFALQYGAVWRTGDLAYNAHVEQALGLTALEKIIGFIYVGTPAQDIPSPPETDVASIFSAWPAK